MIITEREAIAFALDELGQAFGQYIISSGNITRDKYEREKARARADNCQQTIQVLKQMQKRFNP